MPRFGGVTGQLPPFALTRWTFPFPALAAQVGRAALGGPREAALASLAAARLCIALLPPYDITLEDAAARGAQARSWLSGLTLAAGLRHNLAAIFEAAGSGDRSLAADSMEKLVGPGSPGLDPAAGEELQKLIAELRANR